MADKKEFEVDGKALSSLRVVDLKQELEKRCLSKSGSKKDLVDRLKTQLKLERLHESASNDEGHVPNLKLQDEIAEPNDVIKEYLAKQQKIYSIQKEARRRVELEEQQVRDGSEASAGDTSQEEEELEQIRLLQEISSASAGPTEPLAGETSHAPSISKPVLAEPADSLDAKACHASSVGLSQPDLAEPAEKDQVIRLLPQIDQTEYHSESPLGSSAHAHDVAAALDGALVPPPGPMPTTIETVAAIEELSKEFDLPIKANVISPPAIKAVAVEASIEPFAAEVEDSIELKEGGHLVLNVTIVGSDDESAASKLSEKQEPEVTEVDSPKLPEPTITTVGSDAKEDAHMDRVLESDDRPKDIEGSPQAETTPMEKIQASHSDSDIGREKEEEMTSSSSPPQSQPVEEAVQPPPTVRKPDEQQDSPKGGAEAALKKDDSQMKKKNEKEGSVSPESRRAYEDEHEDDGDKNVSQLSASADVGKKNGKAGDDSPSSSSVSSNNNDGDRDNSRGGGAAAAAAAEGLTVRERRGSTGRQRRRSHHRRSISSSSSSSTSSSRSSSISSSESDGEVGVHSRRRSRSTSSSGASEAESSPSRRGSREVKKNTVVESPQSVETKDDNVSRSSPSHEMLAKDDVDTVAIMEVDDDLDSFAPTGSSQSDVAKEVDEALKTTALNEAVNKRDHKEDVSNVSVTAAPPRIASRKISLPTAKERSNDSRVDGSGEKPPQKKRKWGGGGGGNVASSVAGKRTSVSISTDSLKGLIPDVSVKETKPSLLDIDLELPSAVENTPAVVEITRRPSHTEPVATVNTNSSSKREKIVFNSPSVTAKEESALDKPIIKDDVKGKVVMLRTAPVRSAPVVVTPAAISSLAGAATTTTTTALPDPSLQRPSSPTPARNPPSTIVHIRNLVRPYTLGQLKELLGQTGQLIESGFWIDKIKSKCYATYTTEEQAIATRSALHAIQWPSSNPKRLVVDYATQDELDFHRTLADPSAASKPGAQIVVGAANERNQTKPVRGGPTAAVVAKPVADKERRHSARDDRDVDSRARVRKDRRDGTTGGSGDDGRLPVREWDRDKIGERSPGERVRPGRQRGGQRLGSPTLLHRSRSPLFRMPLSERDRLAKGDAVLRDRRDRRDDRRRDMVEEEAPAKLLDDLFRKTKTTPCIYWLPLTSDQIRAKEDQRKQRQLEREKRRREQQKPANDGPAPSMDLTADSRRSNRENRDDSRNRRQPVGSGNSRFRRR